MFDVGHRDIPFLSCNIIASYLEEGHAAAILCRSYETAILHYSNSNRSGRKCLIAEPITCLGEATSL